MKHAFIIYLVFGLSLLISPSLWANSTVQELLDEYQQMGASSPDTAAGKKFWYSKHKERSCDVCHSSSPMEVGKHKRTGKRIESMASSVNPDRFTDRKTIKKWFLRNCKWTLGRECSAQEKSDVLIWLSNI